MTDQKDAFARGLLWRALLTATGYLLFAVGLAGLSDAIGLLGLAIACYGITRMTIHIIDFDREHEPHDRQQSHQ